MNKIQPSKYFFPREQRTIREVTEEFGLQYIGGNELWGWKRRSLYDSRYIFGKPESMSIDEYVAKCKMLKATLAVKFTPVVILKLDGLKIAICHPKLTIPCNEHGIIIEDAIRDLNDLKASEYEQKFPQNCLI